LFSLIYRVTSIDPAPAAKKSISLPTVFIRKISHHVCCTAAEIFSSEADNVNEADEDD
jgi:hypothetical protein